MYELYKGSDKIKDSGDYGVYHGSNPIAAVYKGSQKVYLFKRELTFNASSSFQTYTVPQYVSKIHVDCVASKGYLRTVLSTGAVAGKGGRVQCDLDVTPGQTLYLYVGAIPSQGNTAEYNASDIRTNNTGVTDSTSLNSRIIVAGGGGSTRTGENRVYTGSAGDGGGLVGEDGDFGGYDSQGGKGGTQSSGGSPGGTFGLGGNGSQSNCGGAGWYGGGHGTVTGHNSVFYVGGGGGGSSYTDDTKCSNVVHTQGYNDDQGYITITEIE